MGKIATVCQNQHGGEYMSNAQHAFLLVAFNDFSLLEYRIRLLDDPRNTIFLVVDDKSGDYDRQRLTNALTYSELIFIPQFKIYWAGLSQMKASLELLEAAYNHKTSFIYYHYLMGADLPIKSNQYIHDFCEQHYPAEFLEFEKAAYDFSTFKKTYYHFFVENNMFRTKKWAKCLNYGPVKLQQWLGIKRKEEKKLYAGSALYSITDRFAEYLVQHKEKIYKEYRWTLSCDEVYLQTEIMESQFRDNIYAFEEMMYGNLRLIEWNNTQNTNSPTVFALKDFDRLIHADERLLFARKFEERSSVELIEKLYAYIHAQNLRDIENIKKKESNYV